MRYIVCFGDSITQNGYESGWLSRLSHYYARTAHVVNCGLSGYNSRWYLATLTDPAKRPLLLPDHVREPLFATLLLGSNDMATTDQSVPLGEYIANMEAIIKFIHAEVRPRYGIFLMTPPPVDEEAWAAYKNAQIPNRTFANSRLYRSAVVDIAAHFAKNHPEMNVRLVDIHTAMLQQASPATAAAAAADPSWEPHYDPQAPWARLLVDGLHVNAEGGEVFYATLMDALRASPASADALCVNGTQWGVPDRLVLIAEERRAREAAAAAAMGPDVNPGSS